MAMLSYSTGDSGSGVDVDKVRTATALVRERRPDLLVKVPFSTTRRWSRRWPTRNCRARRCRPGHGVFVFPDLNTGNNTYKAVQRSAGAVAVGPVLQD